MSSLPLRLTKRIAAVGVDRGGTWIRLVAINSKGKPLAFYRAPSVPLEQVAAWLERRLRVWKIKPDAIGVASRGVWKPAKRKALRHALRRLARQVLVLSDVEAAWYAAFRPKEPGIVLIAGTGSIALTQTSSGQWKRAGGLGPEQGDEGSAYWIGREWLRSRSRAWKQKTLRQVAAVTHEVLERERRKDPEARLLLNQAYDHLATLIRSLSRSSQPLVALAGGLFDHPAFKAAFKRRVRREGLAPQWRPLRQDLATAIAQRAL